MGYEVIQPGAPYAGLNNQIQIGYPDTNPDAKHYVMWSGGTDSTLMLYEILRTYGPSKVITISYKYPWLIKEKAEIEKKHRIAFMALANLRGIGGFKHMELEITQSTIDGNFCLDPQARQGAGLPQAVAWMLSVPLYAEDGSYIYDGGIRNDDLTLRLESYHELFRGVAGVMKRNLTLREPYIYLTKANIIEKLIDYDLYEETWFCETPSDGKCCKQCVPCKTHYTALQYISSLGSTELIRMKAQELMKKFDVMSPVAAAPAGYILNDKADAGADCKG